MFIVWQKILICQFIILDFFLDKINNEKYIDWRNRMKIEYAIMQNFKQLTGKLPNEYIREIKQKRIAYNGAEEKG